MKSILSSAILTKIGQSFLVNIYDFVNYSRLTQEEPPKLLGKQSQPFGRCKPSELPGPDQQRNKTFVPINMMRKKN